MTAATDTQSVRVLLDPDGQGLDFTDINDLQELLRIQLADLLGSGIPDAIDEPTAAGDVFDLEGNTRSIGSGFSSNGNDLILTPRAGAGFFRPGAGVRTLESVPGPILKILDVPFTGIPETGVCSFWLPAGTTLTTDVGDATNPRIDLVEVKLEWVNSDLVARDFQDAATRESTSQTTNTRRRVQATIQIRKGTAAASPAYPNVSTADFAPICAVYVPALHNAVHDPVNMRDLRWPIGRIIVHDTFANQAWMPGPSPWVRTEASQSVIGNPGGTSYAYFPCPVSSKAARLIGIGVCGDAGASGADTDSATLVRVDHTGAAPTFTDLAPLHAEVWDDNAGVSAFKTLTALGIADHVSAGAATAERRGSRQPNTRICTPIWGAGYSAGIARARAAAADTHATHLAIRFKQISDNTANVRFVRWFFATD